MSWNETVNKQPFSFIKFKYYYQNIGGARGVMVIVVGNEHDHTSSNPGRDRLHFT